MISVAKLLKRIFYRLIFYSNLINTPYRLCNNYLVAFVSVQQKPCYKAERNIKKYIDSIQLIEYAGLYNKAFVVFKQCNKNLVAK